MNEWACKIKVLGDELNGKEYLLIRKVKLDLLYPYNGPDPTREIKMN